MANFDHVSALPMGVPRQIRRVFAGDHLQVEPAPTAREIGKCERGFIHLIERWMTAQEFEDCRGDCAGGACVFMTRRVGRR